MVSIMTESKQEIIKVFILEEFPLSLGEDKLFPTKDILIRLIKPNTDLTRSVLIPVSWSVLNDKDLGSQLLLAAHTKYWLNSPEVPYAISQLSSSCDGLGIEESSTEKIIFAYLITKYIDLLFGNPPNWRRYPRIGRELSRLMSKERSTWRKGTEWAPIVEEFGKALDNRAGRKKDGTYRVDLFARFPDYAWATEIHDQLWAGINKIPDFDHKSFLSGQNNRLGDLAKARRNGSLRDAPPLIFQCQFCELWFEAKANNGKRPQKCEGCFSCWDRDRRRTANL
jgi:hypothetical protein